MTMETCLYREDLNVFNFHEVNKKNTYLAI